MTAGTGNGPVGAPSPLEALRQLRADAQDSVVALGAQTRAQRATYVVSTIDGALTQLASGTPLPHAIFITGSAGGGKSGAVEFQRQANGSLFEDIVEDATHSDDPSASQAETIGARLHRLSDFAEERPARPVLVAANIGMILNLTSAWRRDARFEFDALTGQLFRLLGLPGAVDPPAGALPLDVRVINIDDRPTAGGGSLLDGMLPMLRPAPGGPLFDDDRCGACPAITHCPGRANATLLSSVGADVVSELAARAAVSRGRHDTPRALWDLLSRLALPESHYGDEEDPCLASQRAHREGDGWWVATGLLPSTLYSVDSDLGRRIAELDPARAPMKESYLAFSAAGLIPEDDATPLRALDEAARQVGLDLPALQVAAESAANGLPDGHDELEWRAALARISLGSQVLLGKLRPWNSAAEMPFHEALAEYARWQDLTISGGDPESVVDQLQEKVGAVLHQVATGLARLFGEVVDSRTFLPVQAHSVRSLGGSFVEFEISIGSMPPEVDRASTCNPEGALQVNYRPIAMRLGRSPQPALDVDLPTYRLLTEAASGLAGGTADAERTFALRRAAEGLAREAVRDEQAQMLVTEPRSGRRYLVVAQPGLGSRINLRARAVGE